GRLAGRGLIAQPAVLPLDDAEALAALVDVLPVFDGTVPPLTLMPVSAFSPDPGQPEVLFASASLFGVGLDLEALAVEKAPDGAWRPLPPVADRYALWQAASGVGDVRPVALPGHGGHFAVFACPLGP
ncbi:hypothetical protein ACM64Y_12145, partial [Novispirillum sp. DQ9]|uniref:hypothetical protein n=1 Tax=Novispirillum sp. DQ9 TaxID=3398612 RepID=UPI003C7D1AEA